MAAREERVKGGAVPGERSRALARGAELGIRFLLGAVLAGGTVLGGASPFGVALVAASGPGTDGLCALLGAAAGYVLSRGLEDGLRYAAASILVFSAAFALYDVRVCRGSWFMPVSAGLLNGFAGFVAGSAGRWTAASAAGLVGEMVLTALAAYVFRLAFRSWEEPEAPLPATRRRVSILLLGAAVLVSLEGLTILGLLSVGRLCGVYAVLCAAWAGGVGTGAAAGVALGLAMDLGAGAAPFYTMAYGLTGLTAGLIRGRGRLGPALMGFLSAVLTLLWGWERGGPAMALYEAAAGAFLFLITPEKLLGRLTALAAGETGPWSEDAPPIDAAGRLRAAASAFSQLFSALGTAFRSAGDNPEDPSVIFDQAANRVCAKCPLRERCWQGEYGATHALLSDALPALLEEGRAEAAMFPQRFRDRCARFPAFLSAVGEELERHLFRRRCAARVGENQRAACRPYGDVARLLEETAQAMAAPARPRTREVLSAVAGVAGHTREGQEVSGDAAGWFKEDGVLYLILCDGMGSGPQARRESDLVLGLLEQFLRSGVRPGLALRTLNEALALREEAGGGFSTVDLLTLDLNTGDGALYKLGAAPSYLRRGGCVTRLAGDSLPAGLTLEGKRDPDERRFRLGPGDSLVLVTDGVLSGGDDAWLRAALSAFDGSAPKALAREIAAHGDAGDDRTALVVRVGLRE